MRRHFLVILVAVLSLAWIVWEEVQNNQPLAAPTDEFVFVGRDTHQILPIDDPQFESVKAADTHLSDEGLGIDVEVHGLRHFYPYQILVWHEIVNESFGGENLAITYSPLSGSTIVFRRVLNGMTYTFENSGKLLNNALVMQDKETHALWPQLKNDLEIYPSELMTWADWKAAYPHGSVLSRQTGFERDYTTSPYVGYENSSDIWYPLAHLDGRLPPKTLVKPNGGVVAYWFAWAAFYPETEILTPFIP